MTTLYLCGAGNSEGVRIAHTINHHERRWRRIVLLDDDPAKHGRTILGVEVIGPIDTLLEADPASSKVANLVARSTVTRWTVRHRILSAGVPFAPLIDPGVYTDGVSFGKDLIVYQHATLGPEVSIGDGGVVFMGAVVGHESEVGECCVIAANAVVNARVSVGDGVYIGSNATILPEVSVGTGATIGAGSAVIEDVPDGATVMGVPAGIIVPPEAGYGWREGRPGRIPADQPAGVTQDEPARRKAGVRDVAQV